MVQGPVETIKPVVQAGRTPLELRSLTYLYFFGIKKAFVDALRVGFGHESTPLRYRYSDNSEKTQIHIYRNFPKRVDKLPALIVESEGGDAGISFLGDEFLSEVEENGKVYYRYGGILTLNINIHIMAKSVVDLEQLMSYVSLYMRYVFQEKFFENNLTFNKINIKPETVVDVDGSDVYQATISTKVTTNFENNIDRDLVYHVQQMQLNIEAGI